MIDVKEIALRIGSRNLVDGPFAIHDLPMVSIKAATPVAKFKDVGLFDIELEGQKGGSGTVSSGIGNIPETAAPLDTSLLLRHHIQELARTVKIL